MSLILNVLRYRLGSDVATSVALGQPYASFVRYLSIILRNRYLWIWGDTLVGYLYKSQGKIVRNFTHMPRNALAEVQLLNVSTTLYFFDCDILLW